MVVGVALCFNLVPTSFNKSSHVILEKTCFLSFFPRFFITHMFAECDDKSTLFFRKSLDCCLHITVIIYYCLVWFFALCVCMCGFFLFPCSLFFLACCIVRVISPESLHLKKKAHVFSPILRHCHCEKCFRDIRYYWYNWILHVSFYTAAIHDNIYIVIMPGVYLL